MITQPLPAPNNTILDFRSKRHGKGLLGKELFQKRAEVLMDMKPPHLPSKQTRKGFSN